MSTLRILPITLAIVGSLSALAAQEAPPAVDATAPRAEDVASFADLLAFVRARETRVDTVTMDLETVGSFPDGSGFRTRGTVRVLGSTHFHSRMEFRHTSGMESITETVRTPDGMQMYEEDEVQGRVFVTMDGELMRRVDAASRTIGEAAPTPGAAQAESPLGSAMLADLATQFDLRVAAPTEVRGERCWVVAGPARQRGEDEVDLLGLGADQVDILVRVRDGAVVQMAQLAAGKPLMEVRITRLEIGTELDPASFDIAVPADVEPVEALDHPPHAAQIQRLFEEAEARGWTGGTEPAPAAPVEGGDRRR